MIVDASSITVIDRGDVAFPVSVESQVRLVSECVGVSATL